ncbi:MAG: tRNA 4-thiouridine(8) synthase ThiI [Candidatus Pacebacteria bacterium]|nr:tRNA 4-thiouridine(8) synthase ThiI [Candidatus Paceibacterota bacterium]
MLVICHYGEIALKGDNRKFFEEKLVENIKKSLQQNRVLFNYVKRISGRILVELKQEEEGEKLLPQSKEFNSLQEKVKNALQKVFGITYFVFAQEVYPSTSSGQDPSTSSGQDIECLKDKAIEILKKETFSSFKVETKRGNKNFALTSQQINEQLGEEILNKISSMRNSADRLNCVKVDLHNPDIILYIEIAEKYAFLYTKKFAGPGGLPLGVSGKAVSLISGGIDSPVASYLMMKRGVENIFVHFYSNQQGYEQSLEKVRDILRVLKKYQEKIKVYFVPLLDIQKEIVLKTKADFRVVLYRRVMFLIANEIAEQEKAKALITGESVGQVASQTLDNMLAIEDAVSLPVLRPLSGWDKQEIMDLAKKIGTYEISILPHLDCCSMFVPEHPATKANLKDVKKEEKKLKLKKLIKNALKQSKIEII